MNLTRLLGLFSAVALSASAVCAAVYTDVHQFVTAAKPSGEYVEALDPYDGVFNIVPAGFQPGVMTVTSASVRFWFNDDEDDSLALTDPVVIDLGSFNAGGELSNFNVNFDTQLAGTFLSGEILGFLQQGTLHYQVRGVSADFFLTQARLDATVASVPDRSSTAMLVATALLGLVSFPRRRI